VRPLLPLALLLLVAAGCDRPSVVDTAPGVSHGFAEHRASVLQDLAYEVTFDIPSVADSAVTGVVTVHFILRDAGGPLVLDFRAPADHVREVRLDGEPVAYTLVPDHIVIPAAALSAGEHRVTAAFRSTDAALNRNEEFLYALFVPDRASTAFPVFEQPDLKARFTVRLTVPAAWQALSNGALVTRDSADAARHVLTFAETRPISTYLLSFAAGMLQAERAERDGRAFTMYHRETDSAKVARNRDAIFDLHATALRWLEDYTGIAYPFGKFDFLAVPAFQFGGMEHPGAIWYRAGGLFLDETATRNQELGRASLIAHETAHMWFGDLVTMRWFDDVWMKEVFANFMAARIAGPSFPDLDLRLRFFQAHHPTAYGVDRTPGANPIRQELGNLREAGSLYGGIIYQKAPIVMRQLEALVGEATFREGLRRYLDRFRFANATWPELIAILDDLSEEDLTAWSRVWVEEPGRPTITARWQDTALVLVQEDGWNALTAAAPGGAPGTAPGNAPGGAPAARALRWPQAVSVAIGVGDSVVVVRGELRDGTASIPLPPGIERAEFVLGGVDGVSYGRFRLDSASRAALPARVNRLREPLHRAVAWQALHEEMLDGVLPPRVLIEAALEALQLEREELVVLQVLGLLRGTYWRFLPEQERRALAPRLERALWEALARAPTPGRKGACFSALVSVTLTDDGIRRLERIWRKDETPRGLPLAEPQYIGLAEALAVRGVPNADAILEAQAARISDPDRAARFAFVRPALSASRSERQAMFQGMAAVEQRRRESWVLDAVGLMNHPLRAAEALPDLRAGLDLVEEIQRTGDIFFPLRWMHALLDGHQSAAAARVVARFLEEHPAYPPRLRGKMLQAADDLFRAARIVEGWDGTVR
jgi:aminopeptidase N